MQPFGRNRYGPKIGGFSNMAGGSHIGFVYCGARGVWLTSTSVICYA